MKSRLISTSLLLVAVVFSLTSCLKDKLKADFSSAPEGLTVTFTNSSTGDIEGYTWDFGDGNTSTDESPEHTYSAPGTYSVSLTVTKGSDSDTKTADVTVSDPSFGTPQFPDADGFFAAVNTLTFQSVLGQDIAIEIGTAIGGFFANAAKDQYADGGTVSINSKNLQKQSNNIYFYNTTSTDSWSAPVNWAATGGSGFAAFDVNPSIDFPEMGKLTSETTINTAADYTITLGAPVTNADSVLIILSGPNSTLQKTIAAGWSSHTLTAAEMSNIGASDASLLQITAYTYTSEDVSGKKIYFINETVLSQVLKTE